MTGRLATAMAVAVAVAVLAYGFAKGTWAVGGSDSSCYALMADSFAAGQLQPFSTLAQDAPWPDAARTFAPAGFIPSPVTPAAASPICAPGFSTLLAPFRLVGGRDGIFFVTPLAGALLVWLAFVIGRHLVGPWTGAAAALLVATIPVFLYQVTQAMNDVVAAAVWMALLSASFAAEPSRPWLLGALAGLATLIRPNLAPASVVAAVWLMTVAGHGDARVLDSARGALRRRHATAFAIAAMPSLLILFGLNTRLYGHLFQSGYGRAADLFSVGNLVPNLQNYGRALFETQFGLPLLGILAVSLPRVVRPTVWLALGVSAATIAVYLLYRPYPEWWYLRFMLPALAPLTVLAIAVLSHHLPTRVESRLVRGGVALVIVATLAWFGIATARKRQAFELQQLESRFRRAADVVRDRLPANALLITVWQSGTVRFHAGRMSLLWDALDPPALEQAIAWLSTRGFEPYLLLERWEEPLFRERFASATSFGQLDWPPRFDIVRQVRIFKPGDRTIYVQGGAVPTEYILR
jgi:hypothetical protein